MSALITVWSAYQNRSCTHEELHLVRSYFGARFDLLFADAGMLIPRDKQQPDPAILSLEEMEITVRIDNGDARVFVRQVFANHTGGIQEGNYIFALPSQATISDFATWDGPTRIPAVILERKRAEEIYNQLKQQAVDPGLLQMGERGAEEAKRTSVFSARIVPIPAFGTKRLEIEYHRIDSGGESEVVLCHPAAPGRVSGPGCSPSSHQFRAAHGARHSQLPGAGQGLPSATSAEHRVTLSLATSKERMSISGKTSSLLTIWFLRRRTHCRF